mgnify:CR=1 FL=1
MHKFATRTLLALSLAGAMATGTHAQEKQQVYLSMSYIGNDWQAEAANMVKALAASKDYADKIDLKVQVAGPNAQRQIQQINAMVQAGAKAIVVYLADRTQSGRQGCVCKGCKDYRLRR